MKQFRVALVAVIVALVTGCSTSPQLVSERSVEDKVASVTTGRTTMADIQAIFGPPNLKESRFWMYNLADTEFDLVDFKTNVMGRTIAPLPFSVGSNVPTNTRALITVRFNDGGIVKGFEVSRYFSRPYIN